jgi:hypothetical protein
VIRHAALAGLLLAGCDDGALPGDSGSAPDGMFASSTVADKASSSGKLVVDVDVDADMSAFLVTGIAGDEDARLALVSITDPAGEIVVRSGDWLFSPETLTGSFYASNQVVAAQWPIRQEDGPLVPGTWKVQLSSTEDGADIDVTTMTKADPDFQSGVVDVQIVWCDGVDQEPGVADAVGVAVERWRTVWADRGLTLNESYVNSDIDPDLEFFTAGSLGILNSAQNGNGHAIQVVIGDLIAGQRSLYGVSAGIPGSIAPSEQTFVLISWLTHAGVDGEFDSYEEKRILGETMAHETGHFMGLAHPVEVYWGQYDALGDTDECSSQNSCIGSLGDNLMFPFPVCYGYATGCTAQGKITGNQERVLQQYLATL